MHFQRIQKVGSGNRQGSLTEHARRTLVVLGTVGAPPRESPGFSVHFRPPCGWSGMSTCMVPRAEPPFAASLGHWPLEEEILISDRTSSPCLIRYGGIGAYSEVFF